MYNAIGTAYIDSFQLEEGDTANTINLLHNSGFEKSSSGTQVGSIGGPVGIAVTVGVLFFFDVVMSPLADEIRRYLKLWIN